jgi:hypothetical protein
LEVNISVCFNTEFWSGNFPGHPATAHEVGIAECYKAALVFSAAAPGQIPAAPPWVQALQANMNQQFANVNQQFANVNQQLANIANDIAAMRNEQPILLANSQAGNREPLYNPTIPGWVLLAPPHPTTRDELFVFTREFLSESLSSILTMIHRGAMHCICWRAGPPTFTSKYPSCYA